MLTRKTLIISNPGEQGAENYCQGVYVDVENYKQYLCSALGGAWNTWEIEHLDRPATWDVTAKINSMALTDYTMVIFCGHGYTHASTGNTILELKAGHEINAIDLRASSRKRTILLDCCRKVYAERLVRKSLFESAMNFAEPRLNRNLCRRVFDDTVSRCSSGVVVGYACSSGEVAGEGATTGGYYSSSMLDSASKWLNSNQPGMWQPAEQRSIVRIHNDAIDNVKALSGGTQTPVIDKPRSDPYFPFAVIA